MEAGIAFANEREQAIRRNLTTNIAEVVKVK
jgi:hypothetical protein